MKTFYEPESESDFATRLSEIQDEVRLVEVVLESSVQSPFELVETICSHVLRSGGKRLRPALTLLCARSVARDFDEDRARRIGACLEMIHMATLMHDDVIDHATLRRGRATASSEFGNTAAILCGDVLLSKAMSILAEDGDLALIRSVSRAVVDLAEGEVWELDQRGRWDLTPETHFDILRAKTASFIQVCCESGARIAGANDRCREALGNYGYHLGMAFQLVDDLIDYRSEESVSGKPRAGDFREGCATMPLILLLQRVEASRKDQVVRWFGNGASEEQIGQVCAWMGEVGAFEEAETLAQEHVEKAKSAVQGNSLLDGELLSGIADYILRRQS